MNIEEKVAKAWYLAQYLRLLEKRLIEKKCHTSNDSQAFKQLFDLVERDTPKKTIYSHEYNTVLCPICKSEFAGQDSFCWNCGQRLDWREE